MISLTWAVWDITVHPIGKTSGQLFNTATWILAIISVSDVDISSFTISFTYKVMVISELETRQEL